MNAVVSRYVGQQLNESVLKAAQIMDALRRSGQDLSARELSDVVGLPKSTAQRLLQTLQACELLHQDSTTRKYGLGPETLCLGMAYLRRVNVRDCARPHMIRLCDRTGETVGLTVRAGADRTYIDQVEPQSELRATNEIGSPYPLWSGAPGRVLLAAIPREELLGLIAQAGDAAFAHASPPTLDGLLASLEKARQEGYAAAFEETIPGVNTIAAPIRDASAAVTAVLSISGPASRFDAHRMQAAKTPLIIAAEEISAQLGWRSSNLREAMRFS